MIPGEWAWSDEHREICRVVDAQDLWGETLYRVWLPARDSIVRVRADRLRPAAEAGLSHRACIVYAAAAARISNSLAHDVLLAPIGASVIPLPHQVQALSRAISGNRVRYLLADEVGLGKTIEAGLILRELKLRGLVRRTLVVAPKGLVAQWVSEMRTHFGEELRLLIPGEFGALRRFDPQENLWRLYDQVVCPMDSVKPLDGRRGWSRMQVAEYNRERFEDLIAAGWDLVIVDECHRLGGSTDRVARFRLGEGLAEAAPYLLLLSATPHQGKSDAFHRLLSLLDRMAFPDPTVLSLERVQPYVIRTEKRRAIDAAGNPLFQPRQTRLAPVSWEERHRQQILPIFLHDDGRILGTTARYLWDWLLEDEEGTVKPVDGPVAQEAFRAVTRAAEAQGRLLFDGLVQEHRLHLEREREKGRFAFESRRRAIQRIGLPAVRAYRLAGLEAEERAWCEALDRRARVEPEMVPILLVRVVGGTP